MTLVTNLYSSSLASKQKKILNCNKMKYISDNTLIGPPYADMSKAVSQTSI